MLPSNDYNVYCTENNDFREVQSQVGVVPPSRRGCVNYTIIQDSVVEQDETFTVRLTSAANPGIRQPRFPEPRSTVVTIVDPSKLCMLIIRHVSIIKHVSKSYLANIIPLNKMKMCTILI